jgi:hypothetical protein
MKGKTMKVKLRVLPKDDPIFKEGLQMFMIRRPLQNNEIDLNAPEEALQVENLEELQKKDREIREQAKNRLKGLARIRKDRSKRLSK